MFTRVEEVMNNCVDCGVTMPSISTDPNCKRCYDATEAASTAAKREELLTNCSTCWGVFHQSHLLNGMCISCHAYERVGIEEPALAIQVGGAHYKKCAIQPTEYSVANGLGFCEGNIIKYVTRYKDKGGREDLEKAKHYLDLLLELGDKYDRFKDNS